MVNEAPEALAVNVALWPNRTEPGATASWSLGGGWTITVFAAESLEPGSTRYAFIVPDPTITFAHVLT
jgi:hypothetical protein